MKKTWLSIAVFLISISLMAQNGAFLKLNLEKNKIYRFRSASEQSISQTMNGVAQTTNVESNTYLSMKMMDATPDFLIAEIRFDTLVTITNAMGNIVRINSASEGNIKSSEMGEVMSCIMNRLSKNSLYVKMDYTGKLIEIVNAKMLSDVVMKDTGSITGATASTIKAQVKNTINDKALKSMIEVFTYNLPGKQVSIGDHWMINSPVNSGGMSLDIATTYKLNALKGNAATINIESNIAVSPNAEPLEYPGAKITYGDITGLGKSTMILNTLTGLPVENKSKTHVTGNLNVSGTGFSMEIPLEINGESEIIEL
jgi:hypothetical protein